MEVQIANVVVDDSIYPRTQPNEYHISRLREAIETNSKFPPIVLERNTYRLIDGRHRLEASQRMGLLTIEAEFRTYTSDAEVFADSVRLNVAHGQPMDSYSLRNSIIRLQQLGFTQDSISQITKMSMTSIDKAVRGFAFSEGGEPVALKGGLSFKKGDTLSPTQISVNKRYVGGKASFYAGQLYDLIVSDMWSPTEAFIANMNKLSQAWQAVLQKSEEA